MAMPAHSNTHTQLKAVAHTSVRTAEGKVLKPGVQGHPEWLQEALLKAKLILCKTRQTLKSLLHTVTQLMGHTSG